MNETVSEQPLSPGVAAYIGIDWADQKHDVVLRSVGDPTKAEHQVIKSDVNALNDWIAQMHERFDAKGKVLVCLEQSRGALIYQLMAYELFELYPINPSQLAHYRKTFFSSGAKDDQPDADLLSELLMCHRDRLKAWKPDDQLTRELATLNEGRRNAVNRRTELANEIKSQLKLYFPVALKVLENDITTALAADLLVQWPTLAELQKASQSKLRKFFYGHNSRHENKILERLALIKEAKPLTTDAAIIRPTALRVKMLAQQLKSLLPYIAQYEKQIAELFGSHPDSFLFDNLPGAGPALAPRLLTAFGTDRGRFEAVGDLLNLSGIAPVRVASGKRFSVHFRWACPKFQRQSFHEFATHSIRFCPWAQAYYQAQIARGKDHHVAVRALAFKWIRILFACAYPTIPIDISRPSKAAVQNTPKLLPDTPSETVNKTVNKFVKIVDRPSQTSRESRCLTIRLAGQNNCGTIGLSSLEKTPQTDRGRRGVSRKAVAFLGATWTLSRLDLQPSKFEILQVPHCQRDPTGDDGEHETSELVRQCFFWELLTGVGVG